MSLQGSFEYKLDIKAKKRKKNESIVLTQCFTFSF